VLFTPTSPGTSRGSSLSRWAAKAEESYLVDSILANMRSASKPKAFHTSAGGQGMA